MSLDQLLTPLLISVAALLVFLVLRGVLLHFLRRRTELFPSLRLPTLFWCLAGAALVALATFPLPARIAEQSHLIVQVLLILSVTLAAANISVKLTENALRRAGSPVTGSGLIYGVVRAIVLVVGLLMMLSQLGVSVAPILTAVGVGGLAVGLALKDTLENLFCGIQILVDGQIRVGDVIVLEPNQEGVVEDIGWRISRLRQGADTLLVPNIKLSQGIVRRKGSRPA